MTFSPEFIATKIKFAELMRQRGWEPVPEKEQHFVACVAKKVFDTAVGPKEALAYFNPSTDLFAIAKGDYQSEGNNALSTTWFPVAQDLTDEAMAAVADKYVADMEKRISQTYAMRLARSA